MASGPTWAERREARTIPNRALMNRIGSGNFYLFRQGVDFAPRLFIISHGKLDTSRPMFQLAEDRTMYFDHALGQPGNLLQAQESASYDKWKYSEKGDVHNYRLSKTQGYHASVNKVTTDENNPLLGTSKMVWNQKVQTYENIQNRQETMASVDGENRIKRADLMDARQDVIANGGGEQAYQKMLRDVPDIEERRDYDVLTVRNRFWRNDVTLQSAIEAVDRVHRYTDIYGIFCRVFSGKGDSSIDFSYGKNPSDLEQVMINVENEIEDFY